MKRKSYRLSLALTLLTLFGLTRPASPQQTQTGSSCVNVSGTVLQSNPTGPATIENKIGGDLAGDLLGIITEAKQPEADGTLRLLVTHVFMTPQGNLYALAESILTPITQTASQTDYTFTERNIIVGGGGKYKGATGEIQLMGTYDLSNGTGSISYSGKVCVPSPL